MISRVLLAVATALLCASCGGGVDSFEDGVEAQSEIMMQMISVLEGVSDEASADKAAGEIEELGNRLAEVYAQMKDMPKPSMEEMEEIAQEQRENSQEFQEKAAAQMMKLAQYESLQDAWMRAMSKLR